MRNQIILLVYVAAIVGLVAVRLAKPKEKARSIEELTNIGKYQRLAMWALLAGFTSLIPALNLILFIPVVIFQVITVYRLANALESPLAVLRCLLCIVPVISLLNLYFITHQATVILKEKGIRIGIMGASKSDFESLK